MSTLKIDQGIHKVKLKVARSKKRKKLHGFSFAFCWNKKLSASLFFWRVIADAISKLFSFIFCISFVHALICSSPMCLQLTFQVVCAVDFDSPWTMDWARFAAQHTKTYPYCRTQQTNRPSLHDPISRWTQKEKICFIFDTGFQVVSQMWMWDLVCISRWDMISICYW